MKESLYLFLLNFRFQIICELKWDEDGNYENLDFRLISTGILETHGQFRLMIKDVDLICCKKLGIGDSDAWNNLKMMEDLSFRMADTFPDRIKVFVEIRILDVQTT